MTLCLLSTLARFCWRHRSCNRQTFIITHFFQILLTISLTLSFYLFLPLRLQTWTTTLPVTFTWQKCELFAQLEWQESRVIVCFSIDRLLRLTHYKCLVIFFWKIKSQFFLVCCAILLFIFQYTLVSFSCGPVYSSV